MLRMLADHCHVETTSLPPGVPSQKAQPDFRLTVSVFLFHPYKQRYFSGFNALKSPITRPRTLNSVRKSAINCELPHSVYPVLVYGG